MRFFEATSKAGSKYQIAIDKVIYLDEGNNQTIIYLVGDKVLFANQTIPEILSRMRERNDL